MFKYKDDYDAFKTLVFVQLIFIVSMLVGKEIFRSAGYTLQDVFPKCFYLLVSALYGFSLFNITQFTAPSKTIKNAIGCLIILIFIKTFLIVRLLGCAKRCYKKKKSFWPGDKDKSSLGVYIPRYPESCPL